MIEATTSTTTQATTSAYENPNGVLGKDDFMMLLLAQLQYQDPTEPTDTATILTQTSQLASLESSENTNTSLENLSAALGNSDQLGAIAAIGKTADLGSNAIGIDEGSSSSFEVYFPEAIANGSVEILDSEGKIIKTIDIVDQLSLDENVDPENIGAGVKQFSWDGTDANGNFADSGYYYVTASYSNPDGTPLETRLGTYPIDSVKFDGASTLVKVGSSYIPIENITEIY